jgi:hypothetical protein
MACPFGIWLHRRYHRAVGDIVVALVDRKYTMKYLAEDVSGFYLKPGNTEYKQIRPTDSLEIFGVVTGSFRSYNPRLAAWAGSCRCQPQKDPSGACMSIPIGHVGADLNSRNSRATRISRLGVIAGGSIGFATLESYAMSRRHLSATAGDKYCLPIE